MRKDLIREIEELLPTFSKGQKTIANYLIHNYDKAAYLTASKLGREVGVSESTVVRFAIELGFDGYPGLQHTLQEIIRTRLTTKQRMEVTNTRIGNGDILNSVLESDIDNIRWTRSAMRIFRRLCARSSARRISILSVCVPQARWLVF